MLKGIDAIISPELLGVLAAMGHGDEIVLADANFPADSVARRTAHGRAIRMDCDLKRASQAVLSLMPVDGFEPGAVRSMQVVGEPDTVPEVIAEVQPLFAAEGAEIAAVERFAFYDLAGKAYAVVQTGERRFYGNLIIRKGVIPPEA
ncbi:RbsD/FucU family protein [Aurantimonas sp. VKM B-3413]|uniref:RbsD/FucU family protein n=1 Tax=Aurantimonas sp. VKM B-3413 TaxID=2779401 RepID=UPI001E645A33|nr:RbsD/FucU domain-containing protein [Aurantimonas sp. VKM B-3413]MCB8838807.1 ribose ABC transporter [Aurantimonas sp. VKM B-3413]